MKMDSKQNIRIVDIFILRPFLVYAGLKKSGLPLWIKSGLVISGLSTFAYNGINFLKNIKKQ